jgi:hypothetical protein
MTGLEGQDWWGWDASLLLGRTKKDARQEGVGDFFETAQD